MKSFNFSNLLLALTLFAIFTGCKEDSKPTPNGSKTASVILEFEHVVDDNPLQFDAAPYTNAVGEKFSVSVLKYYISNLKFKREDGIEFTPPDNYYLIDAQSADKLEVANLPEGDYTGLTYTIGVDSAKNVSGAQTGALDPKNGMFWTWKTGYIFLKLEGQYLKQDSLKPFMYHIGGFNQGGNAIRKLNFNFEKKDPLKVRSTAKKQVVHFEVQLLEFFRTPEVWSIAANPMWMKADVTAEKIANNYVNMFKLDHVHND